MDSLGPIANFLLITLLGLLVAFSPMIVIVNLLVVLKSSRPILRTIVLMAGIAAPLLLISGLAILFMDPKGDISFRGLSEKISIPPIIDLAFGAWLLAFAYRRYQHSLLHGPKKTANLILKKPPDKLSALFTFAFVKSSLSVTNLFAILVITNLIITKQVHQPLATIAVLWVILIGLIPFGVILYFYFFKHERLEKLSGQVDALLNKNIDAAINLGIALIGAFFLLHGVFSWIRH